MNKTITIESDLRRIKQVVDQVKFMLEQVGAGESDVFDIRLCLEEALINAIKYGNKFDKGKKVQVDFNHKDSKVSLTIEDNGDGFDIASVPDPTLDENILKGSGRGVFLIKYLMDELKFNKRGNRITMVKYLKQK
ncbi:MAG: ATP-binding protein [Candidatus Omnitrophica bacterium]|jgi:serine/threonine-protein kinase RsbW|nr:ATP-binding protein [Candidatus Omnitrophota bacterium]